MFANDDSWETSTMTSLDPTNSPPLSVRSPKSDDMNTPQHNNGFHNTSSGSSGGSSGKKKKDKQTTRVRTVLNEHQLSILKKCYALNSRPDALLKEQLVEMTALNARVIRVWFQNKRCKDKKRQIQMRDMAANAEKKFPSYYQFN
ncbi:homeobox domain protein [Ancylostoma caninum]|uniref:Homeobox domain protein n=1 Tax=Ancylostoma caninum TaxID=29170 RepID=A0A368FQ64_ANCCA|nr:homeobox domain protein [Ancylostoma caninum]